MGEIPHSEKMFHLPIEVSVYVPSTQDVDKVISKSEMKLRVDEVKKYLATLFGGFSSSSVEGGFLASDGKVVKENVERVVSFAPKEEFDKNKEALVQKASEWATKWGQEAIGLEHEGDLYYVPQKFENGGTVAIREAKEMANSQALEIKHHASELANALKGNPTIEAWVIAKLERASNDLADVTHYLEGRVQMSGKKMARGGRLNDNIPSTEDLIELVASEREKKINEWRRLGAKVVIGRNDGYSWEDGTTNDNREVATKPSKAKILEIIKNNPNVTEIHFYGTIKVGQRVGEELEIVDDFDVVLWSKEDTLFKKGFQFRSDNGKYLNTIIDKSETVEYKNRKDNGEFVYYQSVDKYGNVGQGRIHREVLQEDLESGNAVEIKKLADGGSIEDEDFNGTGKLFLSVGGKEVAKLDYDYDLESPLSEDLNGYKNEFYISNVETKKEFRGKGYAKRLIRQAIEKAKKLGIDLISLRRDSGVGCNYGSEYDNYLKKIYESVGFVEKNNDCVMILETKKYADGGEIYGNSYSEEGFNLMQKHLEETLKKYNLKYYIEDPKAKRVKYVIQGIDIHASITIYRDYDNYFGKFFLYVYSEKLNPTTQTQTIKEKKVLDDLVKQITQISKVMTPEQISFKKQIDELKEKLEDTLYMYGDSDEEQKEAMKTSKFKNLERKLQLLETEYSKKYADGGSIEQNSNEVQFIKYRDEEIMYDPIFQEFFVNDVMFKTLQEARAFIDKGAPMSDEIKDAYRRGLFKKGGNMEFERPSYKSNYIASQAQQQQAQADANLIADENWNMDYKNDPLLKKKKEAQELGIRAGLAYATKGQSEIARFQSQAKEQQPTKEQAPETQETTSTENSAFPEHEIQPELAKMIENNPQMVQMLSGLGGLKGV